MTTRQKYKDLDKPQDAVKLGMDIVQLKYDGRWACIQQDGRGITATSRTGKPLNMAHIESRQSTSFTMIAEYVFGTQWAIRTGLSGQVFVFDCVHINGANISGWPYRDRISFARDVVAGMGDNRVHVVQNYPIHTTMELWDEKVAKGEFEGLVFRKSTDGYDGRLARCKKEVTDDYVIIDMSEGEGKCAGMVGRVEVGQFIDGELVSMMSVGGGFSDALRIDMWNRKVKYIGTVIEVVGKERFESGALRHPNFVRFRDDKVPRECTYERD